jgi:hypothetical protein
MEKLIHDYLRILDIDPLGYFIRLINRSHHQSLDLSNISIRQFSINNRTLNLYTFNDKIQSLLHNGEVVTVYSRDYGRIQFDIEPHVFIAQNISRWSTDQAEISMNKIVFDRYQICSFATNDVPLLFNTPPSDSKLFLTKTILPSNQYARFIFPYCSYPNNIANPHIYAISDQKNKRNLCRIDDDAIVKHFDSYPRRLTTAPKKI